MTLGEINVELGAQKCKQMIDMMIIPPTTVLEVISGAILHWKRISQEHTFIVTWFVRTGQRHWNLSVMMVGRSKNWNTYHI